MTESESVCSGIGSIDLFSGLEFPHLFTSEARARENSLRHKQSAQGTQIASGKKFLLIRALTREGWKYG